MGCLRLSRTGAASDCGATSFRAVFLCGAAVVWACVWDFLVLRLAVGQHFFVGLCLSVGLHLTLGLHLLLGLCLTVGLRLTAGLRLTGGLRMGCLSGAAAV